MLLLTPTLIFIRTCRSVAPQSPRRRAEVDARFEDSQRQIDALRDEQKNLFEKQFPSFVGLFQRSQVDRDKLLRENFVVEADETVQDAFTCSVMLKDSSLPIAGNLYLTGRGVYFYSNLFSFVTRKFMRFDDMQSIDKVNTYYVFPTGLVFASMNEGERGSDGSGGSGGRDAPEKEIRLMGLLQRCQSYDLIAAVWKTNNNLRPNKTGEVLVSSNRAYFVRDFVKRKEGYMYVDVSPTSCCVLFCCPRLFAFFLLSFARLRSEDDTQTSCPSAFNFPPGSSSAVSCTTGSAAGS